MERIVRGRPFRPSATSPFNFTHNKNNQEQTMSAPINNFIQAINAYSAAHETFLSAKDRVDSLRDEVEQRIKNKFVNKFNAYDFEIKFCHISKSFLITRQYVAPHIDLHVVNCGGSEFELLKIDVQNSINNQFNFHILYRWVPQS